MKSTLIAAPLLAAAALFTSMSTAAAAPDATPNGMTVEEQNLFEATSSGYDASDCSSHATDGPGMVAGIACENGVAGGPGRTLFYLYETATQMNAEFDAGLSDLSADPTCPGGKKNPGTWGRENAQAPLGQRACASRNGTPVVFWSNDSTLVLAIAMGGTNVDELYGWWKSNA